MPVLIALLLTVIGFQTTPDDTLLADLRPEHPRLLFTTEEQAQIERWAETDELLAALIERVRVQADLILEEPTVEYIVVGPRLLTQSREALRKVLNLSMAYRLNGDRRYRDRAVTELRVAAAFPDWNPSHFLDVAEMTTAFALAYDWLYADLSSEERDFIKTALIEHGLEPGLQAYADSAWWMVQNPNNWNQVCNGGLTLGALAIADEEPDLAHRILTTAQAAIPYGMLAYRPDGQYIEGPSYWSYGTSYNVLLIDAVQSALNTDWGLLDALGFAPTGDFRIHTISPTRRYFNYADAGMNATPDPSMFWLADQFDRPAYADFHRDWLAERLEEGSPGLFRHRLFALEVAWYQPDSEEEDSLFTDALFRNQGDVVTLRTAWDDEDALYVGFKGGANQAPHAHQDIGSFVLEADGVRWAVDLGGDNYNLPGYWNGQEGGGRWSYYRLNSLSHNTLTLNADVQRANADAQAVTYLSTPERAHAVMDLGEAYAPHARSVYRGVALLDRARVLVQDELVLEHDTTTVRWGMVTEADLTLDGQTATLRQEGQTLRATILSPEDARFEAVSTHPGDSLQRDNAGTTMLATTVRPDATRRVRLAMLLAPVGEQWGEAGLPVVEPLVHWSGEESESAWTQAFDKVQIPNPTDGVWQPAFVREANADEARPLLVSLHSWSADYRQRDGSLAEQTEARDWHYIHPDFRGPNRTPEACCSERALEDIDTAIDYALDHFNVDSSRIHVVGSSGGGYATLCAFMHSRHDVASFSAWVPISDLPAWHRQSQARGSKYAREIRMCTASENGLDHTEARRRSPVFMETPVEKLEEAELKIYAGVRDGFEGSVPITHSLFFYNKVLDDLGVDDPEVRVRDEDVIYLLTAFSTPEGVIDQIGDRDVLYRKTYGNLHVTIFDGGHEMLEEVALDLIDNP